MNRLLALLAGTVLATGLAFAATGGQPGDLVERYFAATDEAGVIAGWSDWHPDATHKITIKYGMGQPDDVISYRMSDWETLPGWEDDPELAEAMKGYKETARGKPDIKSSTADGETIVTAVTAVRYTWDKYAGKMTQTDRFRIVPHQGALVIRTLETTYDYR